ncbi:fimbrial biogenesis outer membrane usher protein [Salmonella enterica subsp. salamae]|nr:fimbrial biogenesis outer membrane usher protein [Salmonella enterica subsp. salamae]ECI5037820.1 fimbrial biogenesis outer membrane usher protein [Salmonella enterica subsp. salamae]
MLTPKQNVRLMAFTLSFLALSVRAEINNLADSSMPLARAFFDSSMLKNNGLDPELAEYLAVGARFTPGYHNVSLKINGDEKGIVPAKINDAGQLCVDKEFLAAAGLFESTKRETCPQLSQYWRNATVNLIPETETIELVVPFEAINPESGRKYSNVQGGNAAMLNYSVFGTHYKYSGDTNDNFQGTLEMGFNSGDWIFRSTQMLSDGSQQGFSSDSLFTYAQRTFADYGVMVQGGEINVANTRFSVPTIYGVQVMPDTALAQNNQSGIDVTGIARSPQARVDIRQSNQLIYSTLVPAGPFTVANVPVISATTDLKVTVTETDGSESHFTVAASSFRGNSVMHSGGFSFSVGRIKDLDSRFDEPWIMALSNGWTLNRRVSTAAGMVMADNHYYGFSGNLNMVPVQNLYTSLGFLGSIDNLSATDGANTTLDINYGLPYNMAISLGGSYGSPHYRELSELYEEDDDDFSPTKYDTSVGINWSHETLGYFSVSYYSNKTWDSDYDSRRIITSWSKTFKWATVNLNWQSDVSNDEDMDDDMVYASISIPLGRGVSTNTWYREREGETSYGSRVSGSLSRNSQYTLGVSQDQDENTTSWDTSLSSNLHYTSLSLAAGGDNDNNNNYSAQLSGGIVAHSNGVTFSPYALNDTFGIVSLDKPVAGVEINTSRGTVWTDKWGQAVIPSLTPYQQSSLNLNTQSLPGNLDVKNGKAVLKASHGAVAKWQFDTLSQRRVLLNITLENGAPLPKGASITSDNNEYITSAPENGMVFLNDISASQTLLAKFNGDRCRLIFTLPEADPDKFYEEVTGKCVAGTGSIQ